LKKLFLILVAINLFATNILNNNLIKKLQIKSNKIYIIDFFASWCNSCKIELPKLNKLPKKYHIIAIDIDEDKDEGVKFVKELGLNFDIIYDSNNKIVSKFNPIGIPAIYIIKNKKIVKAIFGAKEDLDLYLIKIIKDLE